MFPSNAEVPHPETECVVVREILDRVGDKWSVLVIALLGEQGRRFSELRRSIEGISQRMLTLTLRQLERDGLVPRTVHPTVPPASTTRSPRWASRCSSRSWPSCTGRRSTAPTSPRPVAGTRKTREPKVNLPKVSRAAHVRLSRRPRSRRGPDPLRCRRERGIGSRGRGVGLCTRRRAGVPRAPLRWTSRRHSPPATAGRRVGARQRCVCAARGARRGRGRRSGFRGRASARRSFRHRRAAALRRPAPGRC